MIRRRSSIGMSGVVVLKLDTLEGKDRLVDMFGCEEEDYDSENEEFEYGEDADSLFLGSG
jgi:hypothetical protein